MASHWTAQDIPGQSGRTMVITGANSGIGYEAARALAHAGARVILGCRNDSRARAAADAIRAGRPGAAVETHTLDLASLASVREFAAAVVARHARLDVLINNAGVMAIPRRTTADGFEMQLGTNHLGHFALTGLLLDALASGPQSRVVNVSSTAHKLGRVNFDDLQMEHRYSRWAAYGQSKLANLLFTHELQRRLEAAGRNLCSVACHPGWAATNLQLAGPRMDGSRLMETFASGLNRILAQDATMGALPTLYAATAREVRGGDYIGPAGLFELWGGAKKVAPAARAQDRRAARRLWEISEKLTGIRYAALDVAARVTSPGEPASESA